MADIIIGYYKLNTTAINLRSGPTSGSTDIGDLTRGDVVAVAMKSGSWYQIIDAQHADGSPVQLADGRGMVKGYAGQVWATNAYFVMVPSMPNPPDPEPPPDENPDYILVHWANGRTQRYVPE